MSDSVTDSTSDPVVIPPSVFRLPTDLLCPEIVAAVREVGFEVQHVEAAGPDGATWLAKIIVIRGGIVA